MYTIVTAAAVRTDPSYDGLDPADVTVTNLDDDVATNPANLDAMFSLPLVLGRIVFWGANKNLVIDTPRGAPLG